MDLTADRVLTRPKDLVTALRRLMCFVLSSPYPGQCRRMINPILLPLWALSSWQGPSQSASESICIPARTLLETFLRIDSSHETVIRLVHHLTCNGTDNGNQLGWRFQELPDGEIQAVQSRQQVPSEDLDMGVMLRKSVALVELVTCCCSKEDISSLSLIHI